MVQKKNTKPRGSWLEEELKRIDKEHPVVATKWAVEEVTPAYTSSGYFGQDYPEKSIIVSPEYDTEEDAVKWMDEHEADRGKFLALVKLTGREHRFVSWTTTRVKRTTSEAKAEKCRYEGKHQGNVCFSEGDTCKECGWTL